ncbi:type VI secretion system-associated FHA domain protein TagH [Ensifer adhaerens]|uniref:type VI secretion system-associated FHA domain protein TagH n=1 Tax=Ensifer adhaerens TaxID=106592 RepID=UPI00384D5E98
MLRLRIETSNQRRGGVPFAGDGWADINGKFVIGRAQDCDLTLQDPSGFISKYHCTLREVDGGCLLLDHSRNGTFINDCESRADNGSQTSIRIGDSIRVGSFRLTLHSLSFAESASLVTTNAVEAMEPAGGVEAIFDPDQGASFTNGADTSLRRGFEEGNPTDFGLPPDDSLVLQRSSIFETSTQPDHIDPLNMVYVAPRPSLERIPDDWDLPSDMVAVAPRGSVLEGVAAQIPDEQSSSPQVPLSRSAGAIWPDDAIAAFLEGSGLPDDTVTLDNIHLVMRLAGEALRVTVRELKDHFRWSEQFDSSRAMNGNRGNPLLHDTSPVQATATLLRTDIAGLLSAPEAIGDAFQIIRNQQIALDNTWRSQRSELLGLFEPAALARTLPPPTILQTLIPPLRRAACWNALQDAHASVVNQTRATAELSDPPAMPLDVPTSKGEI